MPLGPMVMIAFPPPSEEHGPLAQCTRAHTHTLEQTNTHTPTHTNKHPHRLTQLYSLMAMPLTLEFNSIAFSLESHTHTHMLAPKPNHLEPLPEQLDTSRGTY